MIRTLMVDDGESVLESLKRVLRLAPSVCGRKSFIREVSAFRWPQAALAAVCAEELDLLIPGIAEVNWGQGGSVILDPEFLAKD